MCDLKLISTVITPSFHRQRITDSNSSNMLLRQYTSHSNQYT